MPGPPCDEIVALVTRENIVACVRRIRHVVAISAADIVFAVAAFDFVVATRRLVTGRCRDHPQMKIVFQGRRQSSRWSV